MAFSYTKTEISATLSKACTMWKKIILNEKLYLLRSSNEDNEFKIVISDLFNVWTENLSEEELLQRCKEMNPLHEASPEVLLQRINELVDLNSSDVKTTLAENNEQLELGISSYLKGVIFKIKFVLALGSPELFFKQMTSPLIQMVEELQARQNKLFDLLTKKDIEIDEYKMGGMKITRKNIETAPFSKEEFIQSCSNEHVEKHRKSVCPTTSFINNCNDLYEGCSKNIKDNIEEPIKHFEEESNEGLKTEKPSTSPQKTTSKRGAGIVYQQDDNEDDDETYFSIQNQVTSKTSVKKEKSPKKKRTRIQDMF